MKKKLIYLIPVLVFILVMLIPHYHPNYGDDTDFPYTYAPAAKGLFEDVQQDPYHGFVYPLALRGVNEITKDYTLAGRLVSALSMVGCIYIVYTLAGTMPALLLIFSAVFWHCAYSLTSDSLAFFIMCLAYVTWRKSDKFIWAVIAGLLAGLAFSTRYLNGLILLAFLIPFERRSIGAAFGFVPPALVQVFLNWKHGFHLLGNNYLNVVNPPGTELQPMRIIAHLFTFPIRFMGETWPLFGILILVGLGGVLIFRRAHRHDGLLLFTGIFFFAACLTFYKMRFLLPLMLPILVGLANFSCAMQWRWNPFKEIDSFPGYYERAAESLGSYPGGKQFKQQKKSIGEKGLVVTKIIFIILIFFCAWGVTMQAVDFAKQQDKDLLSVRELKIEQGKMTAYKATVPYLLGCRMQRISEDVDSGTFKAWCLDNGIRYVLWGTLEAYARPKLVNMEWAKEMKHLATYRNKQGAPMYIFEVSE